MVLVSKDLQTQQDIRAYIERHKPSTWPPAEFEDEAPFKRHYRSESPEQYFSADDPVDLRAAIKRGVTASDRVLTTPQHAPFFREAGVSAVSVYDMSPAQLATHNVQHESRYWGDVFDTDLLARLLSESDPTLMYLSNIPEWPYDGIEQVIRLAGNLANHESLKKVMLAGVMPNNICSDLLADEMVKLGWEKSTFQHDKRGYNKIISLKRK